MCIQKYVIRSYLIFLFIIWIATPRTTPHTVAYIYGHNTTVQLLENAGGTPNYVSVGMYVVECLIVTYIM